MTMQKITFLILFSISTMMVSSQEPSLRLKAFKRYTKNENNKGKGEPAQSMPKTNEPEYFIYLIAFKVPFIKLERVWLNQNLYSVQIDKVSDKPIILKNSGYPNDTLVKYTDELVWKVTLKGKVEGNIKPKKDIEYLVSQNELTLRLNDKKGTLYTRSVKEITLLRSPKTP
jgi:hypothetical protein